MIDFLRGKITPRDWMAIAMFLGVTAAVVGVFYYMVHTKKQDEIAAISETNTSVFADLERARTIDKEIDFYEAQIEEKQGLVREFEKRLPSNREITDLIRVFEDMAAEESIDIDLQPMKIIVTENKETIPYQIVAKGPFHDVASFINRLERYERYLKISDLSMDPYKDGISTFNFTLNTYRFIK